MDIYKLVFGSVSTLLDNLLQPVRHTLHHVALKLAVSHLEDLQPGDLLLQCLEVGVVGVLLQLHLYPAPSSILHPPSTILQLHPWKMASHLVASCWLTGYCVIGMLPFIHVPYEKFLSEDCDFSSHIAWRLTLLSPTNCMGVA
jgi:hypothetical protein